jgi:tetratricopeptide (TPR) repeat protein
MADQPCLLLLHNFGEEADRPRQKAGNIDVAIDNFRTALQWNPSLNFDPEARAKAERLVVEGETLAQQGKVDEAIASYTKALQLNPSIEVSAESWNVLCWEGSFHERAKEVLFACEKAVVLAPEDSGIRDSRGLARALTGDTQGAISDFQAFVSWTHNAERKSQRQRWIRALQAGQNPFTPEELKTLLAE